MKKQLFFLLFIVGFAVIIFAGPSVLCDAGLELDNAYGNIVAIYQFSDAADSGPRDFGGTFHEDARIVKGRGTDQVLRLRRKGQFLSCCNDHYLALLGEFSIVAWVKLKRQKDDGLNISMHGRDETGALVGYATLLVGPGNNLGGVFGELGNDRELGRTVAVGGKSQRWKIFDNKWHHIAFTGYGGIYTLFVDGEVLSRRYINSHVSVFADKTDIVFTNTKAKGAFEGTVFIDDAAFFELGFSVYEIQAIYKNGIDAFLTAMPVEATGKVTTTWGKIKLRNLRK